MERLKGCLLLLLLLGVPAATFAGLPNAEKKIRVRVFDGKSGEKIVPDNLEVRINRERAYHIEFVKLNDDGTAIVTLPATATSVALRATYEDSTEYYVYCDVARQKDTSIETWFPVDDVIKTGIVMPNECRKSKQMLSISPKPGEFVLLVRKHGARDAVPYSLPY